VSVTAAAALTATALAPLGALYHAGLLAREALHSRAITPRWALPCPIVSVGNLTLGGNGKTPLVLWLAQKLTAAGVRPGVALRGYGGSYSSPAERVVPGEEGAAGSPEGARRWGDEACLLAARLRGVPVAVGRERALAALKLLHRTPGAPPPVQVILLDDGFQHRRLRRDLDIVLLDARSPLGNGRLVPAGSLREPAAALARARVVVLSRWGEAAEAERREAERLAGRLAPQASVARASMRPAGIRAAAGSPFSGEPIDAAQISHEGCYAFCAIARPASFEASLQAAAVRILGLRPFRDHHYFSPLELDALEAEGSRRGAAWLITTEKDAARLAGWSPRSTRLAVLRVDLDVEPAGALLDPVLGSVHA
jgi:tetraacyldisaccharide 4'-kinase